MPKPSSDQVLQVVNITLGTAGASATGAVGVAFRLHLRDGTHYSFGLTEAQTIELVGAIQHQIKQIAALQSARKH